MRAQPVIKRRRAVQRSVGKAAAMTVGALVLVASAAACGTTSGAGPTTSPSTSTVAGGKQVLNVATIRRLYLADSAVADAAFSAFTTQFSSGSNSSAGPTVASPAEAKAATETAKTLQKSALQIAKLEAEAPTKIAQDLKSLLLAENVVYQGLLDLTAGYQSRSFNLQGWENSFGEAAATTDQAAAVVAADLNISAGPGNTETTSTAG